MVKDTNDTIAAIATACGESGIGIVRMSGSDALRIADTLFHSKEKRRPSQCRTYTLHYGWIRDPAKDNAVIDEVLLSVMRRPRSYTREDVVEINCHGGIVAVRAVLDACLGQGCRCAEPGEFTRRAFLNGRIDLSQAEAVLDIIRAKTDAALAMGMEQLRGVLSKELLRIRATVLRQRALLEAHIDFPEEELARCDLASLREQLGEAHARLASLVRGAHTGRILREGVRVVICGKPNVGKSSLLNALLRQERSIVTPVAGTTRDTIEEVIDIMGLPIRIVDTAGILEPRDLVERKAVQRSRRLVRAADMAVVVFDASRPFDAGDSLIMRAVRAKRVLAVINKIDLKQKLDEKKIRMPASHAVRISAKKLTNIAALEDAIADTVRAAGPLQRESVLVSNARHIQKIACAQKSIAQTLDSLDNKVSIEFVAQGLADALAGIDEVLGTRVSDDLLETVFAEFCIGK